MKLYLRPLGLASLILSLSFASVPALAGPQTTPLPEVSLTSELMYKLLLAEIAVQRNRMTLSVNTYLEVARRTHNPRIAERAVEVAVFAQNNTAALEAAKLWVEADPLSMNARQTLAGILVSAGRLEDAVPHLAQMLSQAPERAPELFMNLHGLFQGETKKDRVLKLVESLAAPYKSMPEAHYAVAVAALDAGSMDRAKESAQRALALRPGWESAALLEGQRLVALKKAPAAVLFYREFLQKYPKSQEVRLIYARLLVEEKSYDAARAQFEEILKNAPKNADMAFAVALLSFQLNDLDRAVQYLSRALELNYREPDAARFYLGQVLEQKNDAEHAEETYLAVTPVSDQYVPARMRVAYLYAKSGRMAQARDLLHALPVNNNEQRALLVQAEAQLLSEVGELKEARSVLSGGLKIQPESIELLYDRAMLDEKLGNLDDMERDLKKIIRLKPDHAQAYNALGYTLADRTTRYTEALELIEKAVKLAPEDAFIMDSLGWVQYRLGRIDDAYSTLKTAFERQADPEIAAHLVEVMRVRGDQAGSDQLLETSIRLHPDNATLIQIQKRFHP